MFLSKCPKSQNGMDIFKVFLSVSHNYKSLLNSSSHVCIYSLLNQNLEPPLLWLKYCQILNSLTDATHVISEWPGTIKFLCVRLDWASESSKPFQRLDNSLKLSQSSTKVLIFLKENKVQLLQCGVFLAIWIGLNQNQSKKFKKLKIWAKEMGVPSFNLVNLGQKI